MLASNAKAYPSEAPFRCSTLGHSRPYSQTLDQAGKACQGETLVMLGVFMLTVLMRYVIMVVVVKPGDGDGARLLDT